MRVPYTVDALRHLAAIGAYIAERDPAAAARVRQKIEAAAGRLGPFPRIGRRGSAPGTREWKVTGLPYVIVHELHLEAGEVVILGVFHEAQLRPGQTAIPEEN